MDDRSFCFTVVRQSQEECTFATVSGEMTSAGMRKFLNEFTHNHVAYFVRTRVERAITTWILTTDEGKEAWKSTRRDLNVGDLAGYLDVSDDLNKLLKKEGIESLSIECQSEPNACSAWSWAYDKVLALKDQL